MQAGYYDKSTLNKIFLPSNLTDFLLLEILKNNQFMLASKAFIFTFFTYGYLSETNV